MMQSVKKRKMKALGEITFNVDVHADLSVAPLENFYASRRSTFERQLRATILRNKNASFIFDYNTAEAVLLASCFLINLAGICFDSSRFSPKLMSLPGRKLEYAYFFWIVSMSTDIALVVSPQTVNSCLGGIERVRLAAVTQAQKSMMQMQKVKAASGLRTSRKNLDQDISGAVDPNAFSSAINPMIALSKKISSGSSKLETVFTILPPPSSPPPPLPLPPSTLPPLSPPSTTSSSLSSFPPIPSPGSRTTASNVSATTETIEARRNVVTFSREDIESRKEAERKAMKKAERKERWAYKVALEKARRQKAFRRIVFRAMNAKLSMGFTRWKDQVARMIRREQIVNRALRTMQNLSLSIHFRQWVAVYEEAKEERAAAAPIITRGLPPGWFEQTDNETNETYYCFEDEEGEIETQWDRPEWPDENIQDGWKVLYDKDGDPYYLCRSTGETTWDKPRKNP